MNMLELLELNFAEIHQWFYLYLLEFNAEIKDSENFESKDENKVMDTNYEEEAMMEKDPSKINQDSASNGNKFSPPMKRTLNTILFSIVWDYENRVEAGSLFSNRAHAQYDPIFISYCFENKDDLVEIWLVEQEHVSRHGLCCLGAQILFVTNL